MNLYPEKNVNQTKESSQTSLYEIFEKNDQRFNSIIDLRNGSILNKKNISNTNNSKIFFKKPQVYPVPEYPIKGFRPIIPETNTNQSKSPAPFVNNNYVYPNQMNLGKRSDLINGIKKPMNTFRPLKKPGYFFESNCVHNSIKEYNNSEKFFMMEKCKDKSSNLKIKESIKNDKDKKESCERAHDDEDKTSGKINLKIFGKNQFYFEQAKDMFKKLIRKINLENKNKIKICFENEFDVKGVVKKIDINQSDQKIQFLNDEKEHVYINECNFKIKNIIKNTFLEDESVSKKYKNQFLQSLNKNYENLFVTQNKILNSENLFQILNLQIFIDQQSFSKVAFELKLKFIIMIFSKFVKRKSFIANIENFIDDINFMNEQQIKLKIFRYKLIKQSKEV